MQQARLLDRMELVQRGPRTLTDKKSLIRELEKVRCTNIATNDEELESALRSIAAPIRSRSGLRHLVLGKLRAADDGQHRAQARLPAGPEEVGELGPFVAHNRLTRQPAHPHTSGQDSQNLALQH